MEVVTYNALPLAAIYTKTINWLLSHNEMTVEPSFKPISSKFLSSTPEMLITTVLSWNRQEVLNLEVEERILGSSAYSASVLQ